MNFTANLIGEVQPQRRTTWIKPIMGAMVVAWVPAQVIYLIFGSILSGPLDGLHFRDALELVAWAIIIAPVVETYGMRGLFWLLGKFISNRAAMNWTAAVLWGVMHWNTPSWGVHAVWVFHVFGVCYLTIRDKDPQTALYVTMLLHAWFNAFSCGVSFLGEALYGPS
jgi:membrane protease YdiL (CAAX protease family)